MREQLDHRGGTSERSTGVASKRAEEAVAAQRSYFESGVTRPIAFRREQLVRLKRAVLDHEERLQEALRADLHKSEAEGYLTEIFLLVNEINYALKNLSRWARPERVRTDIVQQPARSRRTAEPYGVVLIISPWNYPVQLSLVPLVGAIAAGNCAIVKPSELAPNSSAALARLIADTFPPDYITAFEGGPDEARSLLRQRMDYIFFTGGTRIGRIILRAAADHLTPVTLELGGKSPCVVDHTADVRAAAKRIAFSRFLNAGQTCVSPDYVLVERPVQERLLSSLTGQMRAWWGEADEPLDDFSRIINERHFDRLAGLIDAAAGEGAKISYGGARNRSELYLAPTVLTGLGPNSAVMEEEIFGPVLPVIAYDTWEEASRIILSKPKPLAAYLFSKSRSAQERFAGTIPAGGVCLNDCLSHMTTTSLPFGGVGDSGMGAYHGKESFRTFSHYKSVMKKANWPELPVRYPPYDRRRGMIKLIRKLFS